MPPVLVNIPENSCYEFVTTGSCPLLSNCPYSHQTMTRICVVCDKPKQYLDHQFADHIFVKIHQKSLERKAPVMPNGHRWCTICKCSFEDTGLAFISHYGTTEHKNKSQAASLQLQSLAMQVNRRMFDIKGDTNFGSVQPGCGTTRSFFTQTPRNPIQVTDVRIMRAQKGVDITPFELMDDSGEFPREVARTKPLQIRVSFRPQALGTYKCNLRVTYRWPETDQTFLVVKGLRATAQESGNQQQPVPTTSFVWRAPATRQPEKVVITGAQPPSLTVIQYKKHMPPAPIPSGLASAISQGSMKEVLERVRKSHLLAKLGGKSYGPHFRTLIWIEEAKANEDLLLYDMEGVTLDQHRSDYWLEVPGLAEKRPSVVLGDRILIRKQTDKEGQWFEGRVWDVQQLRVSLRLPGKAAKITAQSLCDVRFKLNRVPLQRQHQALNIANIPDRITFPKLEHTTNPTAYKVITSFVNPLVGTNPQQKEAVKSILSQPAGSVPFVVFGPPGTGKTVTIVEAINQILKTDATARILTCAPSNPAADIIARRLMPLGNQKLFRLYAPSRRRGLVDADMLPFTFSHESGPFSVPPLNQLMAFRVVVATCISAAIPFNVGVPSGHFTHIFIDEAGQATEPEAMVSIRTMTGRETNVILSGDPKQLGPVIRSGVARELGLGKSYLERLMENPLYDEVTGSTKNVVKLTKNFRSHPTILRFPSDVFYRGDLEPCGDVRVINSFVDSGILPKAGRGGFPVVFHATPGKDEREPTSPSFFNTEEVNAVKEYVKYLKNLHIADNDIGVVTPYRAQCQKIRMALKGSAAHIKVGSVEEFQGDERLVIIISTVRSSTDFLEYDARFTLGFVANPRRLNVAITRAKALLLVIGDPRVLSIDPLWRSFLNYVYENGGWKGIQPDWDTTATVDQCNQTHIRPDPDEASSPSNSASTSSIPRVPQVFVEYDTIYDSYIPDIINIVKDQANKQLSDIQVLNLAHQYLFDHYEEFVGRYWKDHGPDAILSSRGEGSGQGRRPSVPQRKEENQISKITARLHSLNVEDDLAGVDRPAFVELE